MICYESPLTLAFQKMGIFLFFLNIRSLSVSSDISDLHVLLSESFKGVIALVLHLLSHVFLFFLLFLMFLRVKTFDSTPCHRQKPHPPAERRAEDRTV